ncbi:MAG: hypothetical protein RSE23_10555, partial [Clostridia bacterium]
MDVVDRQLGVQQASVYVSRNAGISIKSRFIKKSGAATFRVAAPFLMLFIQLLGSHAARVIALRAVRSLAVFGVGLPSATKGFTF